MGTIHLYTATITILTTMRLEIRKLWHLSKIRLQGNEAKYLFAWVHTQDSLCSIMLLWKWKMEGIGINSSQVSMSNHHGCFSVPWIEYILSPSGLWTGWFFYLNFLILHYIIFILQVWLVPSFCSWLTLICQHGPYTKYPSCFICLLFFL